MAAVSSNATPQVDSRVLVRVPEYFRFGDSDDGDQRIGFEHPVRNQPGDIVDDARCIPIRLPILASFARSSTPVPGGSCRPTACQSISPLMARTRSTPSRPSRTTDPSGPRSTALICRPSWLGSINATTMPANVPSGAVTRRDMMIAHLPDVLSDQGLADDERVWRNRDGSENTRDGCDRHRQRPWSSLIGRRGRRGRGSRNQTPLVPDRRIEGPGGQVESAGFG